MKDLFETPENLPTELQTLLNKYAEQDNTYDSCKAMLLECEALGYTFDYYLDAEPYNLRKMETITIGKLLELCQTYNLESATTGSLEKFSKDNTPEFIMLMSKPDSLSKETKKLFYNQIINYCNFHLKNIK